MTAIKPLNIGTIGLPVEGAAPRSAFEIPSALRTGLTMAVFPGSGIIDDFGPANVNPFFVGSPTRTSSSFACTQTDYIDCDVTDTGALSMAIIAKRRSTAPTGYAGNLQQYNSSTNSGVGFYSGNAGTTMAFNAARDGLTAVQSVASVAATLDDYGLYVGRTGNGLDTKVKNLTSGAEVANTTASAVARQGSVYRMRAGTIPWSAYTGGAHIALCMAWSRYLSDSEVTSLDTWATAYAASIGVTV